MVTGGREIPLVHGIVCAADRESDDVLPHSHVPPTTDKECHPEGVRPRNIILVLLRGKLMLPGIKTVLNAPVPPSIV